MFNMQLKALIVLSFYRYNDLQCQQENNASKRSKHLEEDNAKKEQEALEEELKNCQER